MNEIDSRDFGRLEAEVESLQKQVSGLTIKVDALLKLANQGRGGIRALWAVGGAIAAVIAFIGFDRIFK